MSDSGYIGIRAGRARKTAFRLALARYALRHGQPPPSVSEAVRSMMDAVIVAVHEGRDEWLEEALGQAMEVER